MNARDRLITTTARLLQAQGFRQTGLQQILAESGAPRGSLYHYFPGGKDELAVAAIAHATTEVTQGLSEILPAHASPAEALAAVVAHFAAELEATGFEKGCPVATVALEQAAQNPTIQAACAEAYATWQAALAGYLGAQGLPDPEDLAEQLLMLLEGALLLSRARRDLTPLRRLEARIPHLISKEA
ncbi:putative HTH-type transcriptional regulator YxaF [compost metagenome]